MNLDLIYITTVDLSGKSGQNMYSRLIAESLSNHNNISLHLICPEPSLGSQYHVKDHFDSVKFLKNKTPRSLYWHATVQKSIIDSIAHVTKNYDIDGLVTTLKPAGALIPVWKACYSLPMVLLVEGMMSMTLERMLSIPHVKYIGDAIATLSASESIKTYTAYPKAQNWIQSLPTVDNNTVEVFNHGVNIEHFTPLNRNNSQNKKILNDLTDRFVIGYVGSFKEYHCLEELIKGVNRLKDKNISVSLILVGDGPKFNDIQQLVDELNLNNQVHFTGFLDHSEIPDYISYFDVAYGVIDPDHWGSPMKVYEYLSCGKPVIVFDSTEFQFIKTHNAGILVSETNFQAIGQSILDLINLNKKSREEMGSRGREYIIQNNTWDQIANNIFEDFKQYKTMV